VRKLLRDHFTFFLLFALAGLALRLAFVLRLPQFTADSEVYGDIAKNWLEHGIYGLNHGGSIVPTYIRLPGYPAFLATIFAIFGHEHYRAVMLVQVLFDLGTCFVIADLARRTVSQGAARLAFVFAALNPFLANYSAAILTETLEIFFTALALDLAASGLNKLGPKGTDRWIECGLVIGLAITLRPDGGVLLAAVLLYMLIGFARWRERRQGMWTAVVVAAMATLPAVPWTVRNALIFHRLEPLVPRYANAESDFVPTGFIRWVKTWMADYVSVEEIYWPIPDGEVDFSNLPKRAFDNADQYRRTQELFDTYNKSASLPPQLDGQFAALARERIHDRPLRYYVVLPLVRLTDMWLRPRTELLPNDTRWWDFSQHWGDSIISLLLGVLNAFFVGAALYTIARRRQYVVYLGLFVTFLVLRCALLVTLENPEPRYTLECFPAILALAAAAFYRPSRTLAASESPRLENSAAPLPT
jgi:4-amino-4-deoxy-L-arabinose transferase-like glycosyltransferase